MAAIRNDQARRCARKASAYILSARAALMEGASFEAEGDARDEMRAVIAELKATSAALVDAAHERRGRA